MHTDSIHVYRNASNLSSLDMEMSLLNCILKLYGNSSSQLSAFQLAEWDTVRRNTSLRCGHFYIIKARSCVLGGSPASKAIPKKFNHTEQNENASYMHT